ncbi:hypothetical protein [Phreatobacter stygius]|uniref:Uncharacterized protein n=1 Tax=Phreatobacter stygius TaxID=1940610 RepID=A0A4D7AWS1_9HYPH|nr:hypothetical protein [Phreatobacter stygius]QCI64471.1 hypothetical protein E8M01_09635 [Phreatobacter stygius]
MSRFVTAFFASLACFVLPAHADEATVRVTNESVPTLCAEEDNVDLRFHSPSVRRFRIEAQHPAVIGSIVQDSTAPDFTNCTITDKADHRFTPRRVVLHDDPRLRVVGITFDKFWRPERVPVTVAGRRDEGFHLIQLFWKGRGQQPYEFLVLYPVDGYWRIKPRPPRHLRDIVYGTSFLVGPIEVMQRPVVNLSAIAFDPASLTFDLTFKAGGTARLKVQTVDRLRVAVEVELEQPVVNGPFAGLRSMYVAETNADGAHVDWRAPAENRWHQSPVMNFQGGQGIEVRLGRHLASRHNTSSPDHLLSAFRN